MKRPIAPAYTFNPGSATLNLSGIAGFALGNLFAVIDLANGRLVYAPTPGYGASAVAGTTLTLQAPMTGLGASDPLMILYDDGGKPAEDASVQAVTAAVGSLATELAGNHTDLSTLHGDLQAVLGDLASGLGNDTTALAGLAATGTWQANVLTALAALLAKLGTRLSVSLDADSVSLTLPSGLALDASVQSMVAALATLNTALGSNHADLAAILAKQPAAPALDASVQAVVAALATLHGDAGTTLHADLGAILAKLGTKLSVSIDGDSIALSLPNGLALDTAVQAVVAALATLHADAGTTLHADLGAILAKIPALGQAVSAASLPVVLASDGPFATNFGSQSDAAATADTGAFSLIALIKRGLARLTTLLNVLPASLGAKASAAAFPVVLASDQAAVPVTSGKPATAGDTAIATGGTAQALFAGATPANGWKVANPDPAEDLWVSDSATAAPNGQGCYRIPAGGIVTTEPGERPAGPVSVYGASTGHLVTARSW